MGQEQNVITYTQSTRGWLSFSLGRLALDECTALEKFTWTWGKKRTAHQPNRPKSQGGDSCGGAIRLYSGKLIDSAQTFIFCTASMGTEIPSTLTHGEFWNNSQWRLVAHRYSYTTQLYSYKCKWVCISMKAAFFVSNIPDDWFYVSSRIPPLPPSSRKRALPKSVEKRRQEIITLSSVSPSTPIAEADNRVISEGDGARGSWGVCVCVCVCVCRLNQETRNQQSKVVESQALGPGVWLWNVELWIPSFVTMDKLLYFLNLCLYQFPCMKDEYDNRFYHKLFSDWIWVYIKYYIYKNFAHTHTHAL